MTTDMTIYLIEDNNSAVAQALRNFWKEREEKRKTWLAWKDEHLRRIQSEKRCRKIRF